MVMRTSPKDQCDEIVRALPMEMIGVSLDGQILFCNDRAQTMLAGTDGLRRGDFMSLWSDSPSDIRAVIRRTAGTSVWQPMALTLRDGVHRGMRMHLRGRGIAEDRDGAPTLLVMSDPGVLLPFEEHRTLVRKLNGELAQRHRIESRLEEALGKQQRLHRELVHRVKNNLALLSAMIRLKAAGSDGPTRSALEELGTRTIAMGVVHEVLDTTQEIDVVDAATMIERLCAKLQASICPPGVTIERSLEPHALLVADATPLCLLVNELVTNAVKHAFRDSLTGVVEVKLKRNGVDKIEVGVADNGAGLDAGERTSQGLGRRIVEALAGQLRGELTVRSQNGTIWQLVFPPTDPETQSVAAR
jgi:two-component sensor histidine kinase